MIEMTSTFPKTYSEVTDEHARSAVNVDGLRKSGPKMESDAETRGDGRMGASGCVPTGNKRGQSRMIMPSIPRFVGVCCGGARHVLIDTFSYSRMMHRAAHGHWHWHWRGNGTDADWQREERCCRLQQRNASLWDQLGPLTAQPPYYLPRWVLRLYTFQGNAHSFYNAIMNGNARCDSVSYAMHVNESHRRLFQPAVTRQTNNKLRCFPTHPLSRLARFTESRLLIR